MKLEHHTAISVVIAGILYMIFKSWSLAISSLLTGILIDLDHLFDYFFIHNTRFNIKDFFDYFYEERHQKLVMIFHGWEWLILLGIIAKLTNWNPVITGILIGFVQHIILDIIFNVPTSLRAFFVLWRYKNNFESKSIYPKNRKKKRF
jgi:hypothetical protein